MKTNLVRRAALRPLVALTLSCGVLAGLMAPTLADTKDDIKRERDKVNQQIKKAEKQVRESTKRFEDAKKSLANAERQLATAKARLQTTQGQLVVAEAEDLRLRKALARAETKLLKAEKDLQDAETTLGTAESEVEQFTVDTLLRGDSGMRAFGELLQGADPMTFSEQMSMNTTISDSQIARMQELAASRVLLDVERDKVEDLRDQVAAQQRAAEDNLLRMEALHAQAQAQAVKVQELVKSRAKSKKEADDLLGEDLQLQAELEADRDALSKRLQKVIEEELRKNGTKDDNTNSQTGDSGGTLSRPVNGRITSAYGMRKHPITGVYKLHDGTDFGVSCGTPIKAAAGGTIIEQYYNRGYGNRVILNNGVKRGVSVITTYNHLSKFALPTGTKVVRGQVIGYVGTTGYSTGCHLHFMVLSNGRTTNPMSWL